MWQVVVTRKPGELRTYVNGRLCAEVKLVGKEAKEEGKGKKGKGKAPPARFARGGKGGGDEEKEKAEEKEKEAKENAILERFTIDPMHLALFAAPEAEGADDKEEEVAAERGLALRYVQLTSELWDEDDVRKQVHGLRAADEE